MAERKKIIVGNWKMHLTIHEASVLVHKLSEMVPAKRKMDVVIAAGFLSLPALSLQINHRQFKLAAQNVYWRDEGAFTGEVSAHQLRGLTQYVIVGHSERRHVFSEADKDIRNKVQAVVRNHMTPILCVGETVQERHDGETNAVLHDQLSGGLANLTDEDVKSMVIAYEPVWAIGSGENATAEDVESAAKAIRRQISHLYGKTTAESVRIIYGGSVNASNVKTYADIDDIDGFLPGGASLNAHEFSDIIKKASS